MDHTKLCRHLVGGYKLTRGLLKRCDKFLVISGRSCTGDLSELEMEAQDSKY